MSTMRRVISGGLSTTPSKPPTLQNGNSPLPNGALDTPNPIAVASSSPAVSENSPWVSTIGHVGTTGKSGRVIERLQADNDRLKRELNAEVTRREEAQRSLQTHKPQLDALREENANLAQMHESSSGLLTRKDRKIAELKEELDHERKRRAEAERRTRDAEKKRDEIEEQSRRKVQQSTEMSKQHERQLSIQQASYAQMSTEYQQRTDTVNNQMQTLTKQREEDKRNLAKLEIVCEQMRQKMEHSERLNHDLSDTIDLWKQERDEEKQMNADMLNRVIDTAYQKEQNATNLEKEAQEVLAKMKWVIANSASKSVSLVYAQICASPPANDYSISC